MEFEDLLTDIIVFYQISKFSNNGNILQKTLFSCSTIRIISLPNSVRKNTEISPNFLVWKFCANAQYFTNDPKRCGNCAFSLNFHNRKLGEITVIYTATVILGSSKVLILMQLVRHQLGSNGNNQNFERQLHLDLKQLFIAYKGIWVFSCFCKISSLWCVAMKQHVCMQFFTFFAKSNM